MKIALVCTEKLPVPPVAGGAVQLYIEGVLPELSKHHDITVFSVDHPDLPNREEVDGVKYIRVSGQSRTEYLRNISANLSEDYDLIHVFNRPRFVTKLGNVYPNTKFSLSLHNEMFGLEKISTAGAIECINRVEFITTVSKFIADGVSNLYPIAKSKLHPVYSGVDTKKYKSTMSVEGKENKENLKRKYGIEDKKVVLFVGRLSVKKGVDKLLNAVKKVMNSRDDVALVVIGSKWYGKNTEDEYTKSIEALSRSLKGPIVFTGFLPPSEIPEHYNIGDVFVCPSQWDEPLARVHYEAMAAGLPIITTNRGGNAEVVRGFSNGIVIDDFTNSDAFAEKIIELLDNSSVANEMGQTGRMLAEEKYDWNRVALDLLKLFDMVEKSISEKPIVRAVKAIEVDEDDEEKAQLFTESEDSQDYNIKETTRESPEEPENEAVDISLENEHKAEEKCRLLDGKVGEHKEKIELKVLKRMIKIKKAKEAKEAKEAEEAKKAKEAEEAEKAKEACEEKEANELMESEKSEEQRVNEFYKYPRINTIEAYYLKLYEKYLD